MGRTELKSAAGVTVIANEGASSVVTATLYDTSGDALNLAALLTLTLSLVDQNSGEVINSRSGIDILNTSIGTVAADGTLTIKLQPADNVMIDTNTKGTEYHTLELEWTWTDGDGDSMTGRDQLETQVRASVI